MKTDNPSSLSEENSGEVLNQLHMRQRKLEHQNASLRRGLVELDALRAHYFNIYEMAPIGYFVLDEEGIILEANVRASTILGIPRGALDNQPLTQFFADEEQAVAPLFRKALFDTGAPQVFELRMKQRGGAQLWVRLEVTAVRNQSNGARIGLATISDITKTRNLQLDVARTDRLAKMDVLAGGVAHEINNPLTFVLHSLERLMEDLQNSADVTSRMRQVLRELIGSDKLAELADESTGIRDPVALAGLIDRAKKMSEGMLRIKEVVGGLTAFSCVEQENVSGVNLNHAVEQAIELTASETDHHAVVSKDLGWLPEMMASDGKMVEVFKHLIVNAACAIDEGKPQGNCIAIRTWAETGYVFAEVTDTGCGISQENLDNIFEPFFSTKGSGRGCGLGLAITRRIVSSFGGEIRAESTVGEGARFLLRFPIRLKPSPSIATETSAIRGRILVVDDEALIREVIVSMLEKKHEIVAAESGRAAKHILKTDARFDLIMCDLMMPEVSGIDLHAWLVDNHPPLARQLVFMTGGVFVPGTNEYLKRANNIIIKKPFGRTRMIKLVGEQLIARRSGK